ncbi:MAG: ABC transporter permease [Phycisphaerales bacterium]|nr:MAG: ABC transporter permease [Phycisphaerales bacterium]
MRVSISTRYAICSLRRHLRRTILAILGIGLGSAVCLFMIAFVRGEGKMMLKAAAESGAGHLRIVPAAWPETRENDLRLADWQSIDEILQATEGIGVVTPHARTEGLLAFGTRVAGVEIVGVDPNTERTINRLVRNVVEGQYLRPDEPGTTVVGRALARRLDVTLDDPLMVTVANAENEMSSAMLRIVGIVETGSQELDGIICHVNLPDVEHLTGRAGAADLTALVDNPKHLARHVRDLQSRLPDDYAVVTWKEIMPELASGTEVDETWTRLTVGLLMTVVFLGIMSAQLAAVLERRREFAVLSALGMKSGRLIRVMVAEGVILGLLGSVLGLAFGLPAAYYVATHGIDFTKMYGTSDLAVSNVLFDPVFKGDFGWWLIPLAFELALTATVLSSFYPAWFAIRTDPAAALRVEQ